MMSVILCLKIPLMCACVLNLVLLTCETNHGTLRRACDIGINIVANII